jgi:outer membrane lipoprotein SlyB
MKNTFLAGSLAVVTLCSVNAMGASCPKDSRETAVSGTVSTINISETQQVGSIELTLIKNGDGKVLFDQHGTVVGTITGTDTDEAGRPVTILSHVISFDDGSSIETMGDTATILYPTSEQLCSFVVEEIISNFWGTQIFKRATGTIRADGEISFPPACANQNQFDLSGTVCLHKDSIKSYSK